MLSRHIWLNYSLTEKDLLHVVVTSVMKQLSNQKDCCGEGRQRRTYAVAMDNKPGQKRTFAAAKGDSGERPPRRSSGKILMFLFFILFYLTLVLH